MRALIIEDDGLAAMLVADLLGELGFDETIVVPTADEAVAEAARGGFHLVTADFRLKRGNGVDAARRILAGGAVPLVFVTASATEVEQLWPEAAIVGKPIHTAAFRAAVRKAMGAQAL
jgi:CheY-like chemotaxis protein